MTTMMIMMTMTMGMTMMAMRPPVQLEVGQAFGLLSFQPLVCLSAACPATIIVFGWFSSEMYIVQPITSSCISATTMDTILDYHSHHGMVVIPLLCHHHHQHQHHHHHHHESGGTWAAISWRRDWPSSSAAGGAACSSSSLSTGSSQCWGRIVWYPIWHIYFAWNIYNYCIKTDAKSKYTYSYDYFHPLLCLLSHKSKVCELHIYMNLQCVDLWAFFILIELAKDFGTI